MKQEHKSLAENIIEGMKKSKSGLQSDSALSQIIKNDNLRTSILAELDSDYGLIKKESRSNYRLTAKGWEFESFEKLEKEVVKSKIEKDIQFKKTNIDLELAERTLKDYPKTKLFSRIGAFTGIVLLILKVVEWIMKLRQP